MTLLLLGGLSLLSAVPTWLSTTASTALDASVDVTVSGTTAAPGVSAAALVVVAAALSLGLVGRAARWVSLLVVALGGAVIGGSALSFVLSPDAAARSGVADATGVARSGSAVDLSVAPYVTVVLGAVVVVVAVWAAFAPVDWGRRSRRYDAPATGHGTGHPTPGAGARETAPTPAPGAQATAPVPAALDAPTTAGAAPAATSDEGVEGAPRPVPDRSGATPGRSSAAAAEGPLDERDTWDSLTQGDDPT